VLALKNIPDADKLKICRGRDQRRRTAKIDLGAPNARERAFMSLFARSATYIPGARFLRSTRSHAKIRGIESFGIDCARLMNLISVRIS